MKNKVPNIMKFEFIDNTRKDIYNETCIMEKRFYGETRDGQVIDIETYYIMCKEFAAAMGFGEKTIEEWFGEY